MLLSPHSQPSFQFLSLLINPITKTLPTRLRSPLTSQAPIMTFSRFLRRAASSAAPLLLRSFSASACASRPLSLVSAQSGLFRLRWTSSFSSSSSSAMSKAPIDASLLRVIESEIKCAEESQEIEDDQERVDEVPEGFPFEIEDENGMNIIRLKRIYQGKEKIEVTVSMPSLVTGEEPEGEDEDEDREGANSQAQSHIPIIVKVSKDKGAPALEFACTAYPDEVVIDSMSVIESRGEEEEEEEEEDGLLAYEGPDFNDLDENLQKAFHKYLELRGITPLNTNFLHEYMINKDSREYLLWLRNLKAFVQK